MSNPTFPTSAEELTIGFERKLVANWPIERYNEFATREGWSDELYRVLLYFPEVISTIDSKYEWNSPQEEDAGTEEEVVIGEVDSLIFAITTLRETEGEDLTEEPELYHEVLSKLSNAVIIANEIPNQLTLENQMRIVAAHVLELTAEDATLYLEIATILYARRSEADERMRKVNQMRAEMSAQIAQIQAHYKPLMSAEMQKVNDVDDQAARVAADFMARFASNP